MDNLKKRISIFVDKKNAYIKRYIKVYKKCEIYLQN